MKRYWIVSSVLGALLHLAACGEGASNEASAVAQVQTALTVARTFDGLANGTVIDNYYAGVTFREALAGGHVYADALGGSEAGNVISTWLPVGRTGIYATAFAAEEGAVDATFSTLQRTVSIDARLLMPVEYLTTIKKPYLQAFDAAGNYISGTTVYYDATPCADVLGGGCGWQTLIIRRASADIKRVRFSSQNNFAGTNCTVGKAGCPNRIYGGFYGQFDNLRYDDGTGSQPPSVGCFVSYQDGIGRALPTQLIASGATIESCAAAARSAGYTYAGVQYYGQCYAGNAVAFARAPDGDCSTPCTANAAEMCGGVWRNGIYPTGVGTATTGTAAFYRGCYVSYQDGAGLALPTLLQGSGATIESCQAAARAAGFKYAGVQYFGQCYGGNAIAFTKAPDSDCNTPCTANGGEMCGGTWRNSIYATGL